MRRASLAAAGLLAPGQACLPQAPLLPRTTALRLQRSTGRSLPKKKIRTTAYDGQIPGRLLRLAEGKPVTIEIVNRTDHAEIVHWHGQWILVEADGSMEEGSPMIPAGASAQVTFTPRPSGLHWYHTHAMGSRGFKHGLYTGQFGMMLVDPAANPAAMTRSTFLPCTIGSPIPPPAMTDP